ncbi:MAG: 16S rRNA (adenine(1518)-N(6)/adenine(1519)-N(6))-dimethyltransferase RsmA [Myxococcota bacterium]
MRDAPLDAKVRLGRAGLRPKKSWGQNFLSDSSVHESIADAIGAGPDTTVVELGAGLGALTHYLLARGSRVVAIERDRELIPLLREHFEGVDTLEVVEANAATLSYSGLAARLGGALRVAGNLPYQISSRILVSLADSADSVERAVVLVQREVADRLAAPPGGKTRGLLSVLVQRRFHVERLRVVAPGAFHPPPKVHSAVARLTRTEHRIDPHCDALLVELARLGFASRRKNLRNGLKVQLGASVAETLLVEAKIESTRRAETLSIEEWNELANVWLSMKAKAEG